MHGLKTHATELPLRSTTSTRREVTRRIWLARIGTSMSESDQSTDKPEPCCNAFLNSRKSEPIDQHADHHHHDHHRNDLSYVIEIPAGLKQPSQSVALHREDHLCAHQRSPGEAESLSQASRQRREARGNQDVAIHPPATCAQHHPGTLIKRRNRAQAIAQEKSPRRRNCPSPARTESLSRSAQRG